ncbi:alpha/beta hydrolase [Polaribacter pacificus]|uniref:Alpha/beta hydrolase n=2 Tax=Polaribacter pacificus TaxID=1775173 RepID=A0A917HZL2_9FLAO|nr:alpha/beta hydrolase [Polaribacter pacificus]
MKEDCVYTRKRLLTWDDDFMDLDFSLVGSNTLALLIHGLEGSSQSKYILSTTNELNAHDIDTVALNLRGCSGEDNLLLSTYHSGKTEDIDFVIEHLLENYQHKNLLLIGFSLGGNLTLKYMGEYAGKISPRIKGAIAVSVPIDIESSEQELDKLKNKLYLEEFLKTMRLKILEKAHKFPDFELDKELLFKAKRFKHVEKLYTVPVFGFDSPEDYWKKASSKPFLLKINQPTLLINAKDDTFLGEACYPFEEANNSDFFFLEVTNFGGHVGFISSFKQSESRWLEKRIYQFIKEHIQIEINKTISKLD